VAADVPGGDDARACSELVREVGADESPLARVLGAVVGPAVERVEGHLEQIAEVAGRS